MKLKMKEAFHLSGLMRSSSKRFVVIFNYFLLICARVYTCIILRRDFVHMYMMKPHSLVTASDFATELLLM